MKMWKRPYSCVCRRSTLGLSVYMPMSRKRSENENRVFHVSLISRGDRRLFVHTLCAQHKPNSSRYMCAVQKKIASCIFYLYRCKKNTQPATTSKSRELHIPSRRVSSNISSQKRESRVAKKYSRVVCGKTLAMARAYLYAYDECVLPLMLI